MRPSRCPATHWHEGVVMGVMRMPSRAILLALAVGAFDSKALPPEEKKPTRTHGNAFAKTNVIRLQRAQEKRARKAAKRKRS